MNVRGRARARSDGIFAYALALGFALPTLALLAASGGSAAPGVADAEDGAHLEVVATGLDAPVALSFGPDGTLYYVELRGGLRAIPPGALEPDPEPLWVPANLQAGGEQGLVGLALDPDFDTTAAFFVFYTVNESGQVFNRVSRIAHGEETPILDRLPSGFLHNSGRLAFLPDRTLLVSLGDTILDTAGRHRAVHAHDETNLSGKILRIERDGSVPADNPWGNEVWSKGHRNVFGLAVNPQGNVLATENGPEKDDEINVIRPGLDYGWPTCTGVCGDERFEDPVIVYERTVAPTGATWYRGHFYYGVFNAGSIMRAIEDEGGEWRVDRVVKLDQPRVLEIEAGPDGLYLSTWDSILRLRVDESWLVEDAPPVPFPGPEPQDDEDVDESRTDDEIVGENVERPTPWPAAEGFLVAAALSIVLRRREA